MKQTIKTNLAITLVATLFVACGTATSVPTASTTVTHIPSLVIPSATTLSPLPTIFPLLLTATPDHSLPVSSAPDGIQMAYTTGGNLYFQDGSKPLEQMTYGPVVGRPIAFSEDGKQIFFERSYGEIYSVHVDGSHEQALVTRSLLATLGPEYEDESTTFCEPLLVPHSQLLLFRTCTQPATNTTEYQDDLFSVDADTGKIKTLLARGKGGSYYVSPDGGMIAIDKSNYIDIIRIDGRMIRHKLATHTLSEPYRIAALVYWLSDSRGLILALPINTFYDSSPPPLYEVWRYSLATGKQTQIKLDPPIMSVEKSWVSPDGNWITYCNSDEGCFLGSLRDGHTQPIGLPGAWSPDNVHFVYDIFQSGSLRPGLYLAAVDAPAVFIDNGEFIVWLDASRYIYFARGDRAPIFGRKAAYVMGEIGKEPVPILTGNIADLFSYANIIFRYQPSSE